MIPEPTEYGYEGFDSLAERTNYWLLNQPPNVTVVNMQSVMAMLNEGELLLLSYQWYSVTRPRLYRDYPRRLCSRRRRVGRPVASVCLSVCPRSKRKTA